VVRDRYRPGMAFTGRTPRQAAMAAGIIVTGYPNTI